MLITLKQMRYAIAAAEEGHFGRAAKRCNVTQPALSQQIRLLEDFCGTPLFERNGKSVCATPFGREFLARANSILREAQALAAFAAGHNGVPSRPVRFGLIPTIAPYLLPDIYPDLKTALPDIELQISESRTEHLLNGLVSGEIDVALIATRPPSDARLTAEPLFTDPFVLAISANTLIPGPVAPADLPKDRILLLDEGHCFRDQAIDACALQGAEAARAFAATSLSTIVEFVANGQGITLLPAISLRKEAADPRIAIAALAAPGVSRTLSLVWRETTPYGEIFRQMAGIIRAAGSRRLAETFAVKSPDQAFAGRRT